MPMAPKTDAEKVAKLREMAKDKTLPQEVRNTYLDQAVKLAKGGDVKTKKMMYGGMAEKTMMAKGGAAKKELPMRGQRTATNMAKGGSVAKKAKK